MMYLDYKGEKENSSIFCNFIAVLFPNTMLNSFSLCLTVGFESVILSMICFFIMFLTKTLLKHCPRLSKNYINIDGTS